MWYDLLVVCILILSTIRGAMRGIVWQLAVIASLVFCFFFAGSLSAALSPLIHVEPPLNRWITMFLLYLGFSFLSFGAARILHEMIEKIKFDEYDRHLGAVLGLFKGVTFCLFLTFFLVTLSERLRESILNSQSGYAAAKIMDRLDTVMPEELHAVLEPYMNRLEVPGRDPREAEDPDATAIAMESDRGNERARVPLRDRVSGSGSDPFHDAQLESPGRNVVTRDRRPRDNDDSQGFNVRRDPSSRFEDSRRDSQRARRDPEDARRDSERPLRDPASAKGRNSEADWLSTLPATIDEEGRRLAGKAWRNTKPEHRSELVAKIAAAVPAMIRDTIRRWENGRPATDAGTAPRARIKESVMDADPLEDLTAVHVGREGSSERSRLEREIASIVADDQADQQAMIDTMERSLQGIPPAVTIAVLVDWKADLLAESPDPDPQTTARTSLKDRINRQLSKAGAAPRVRDTAREERAGRGESR